MENNSYSRQIHTFLESINLSFVSDYYSSVFKFLDKTFQHIDTLIILTLSILFATGSGSKVLMEVYKTGKSTRDSSMKFSTHTKEPSTELLIEPLREPPKEPSEESSKEPLIEVSRESVTESVKEPIKKPLRESYPHNIYLPGIANEIVNNLIDSRSRPVGEFQCIWALRIFDPKENKESYRFLNEFPCIENKNKGNQGKDIFTNDFCHLESYRTYYYHDVEMLIRYTMSDLYIPQDIISTIYYKYYIGDKFRILDPRTRIISVPDIATGQFEVLESIIIFDGFMNAPSLRDMMGSLEEIDKMDIFGSLLSFYRNRSFQNNKTGNGIKIIPLQVLTVKFLEKLNPQGNEILNAEIIEAFRLKEEYERNKSISDGIHDMRRVFAESGTIRYLPESMRVRVGKEMLLYSLILEKISVFPNDKLFADKDMILKAIFGTFVNRNLILIDDRSIDGNEGFLYRNTYSNDYYLNLKGGKDYRNYFRYDHREDKINMIKFAIDKRRSGNIGKMIDFTVKGIRFYDWMHNYYIFTFLSLPINSFFKTVSFWNFKVMQYLDKETEFYISKCCKSHSSYKIRESINTKYLAIYLSSIETMLLIDQSKGIRFGLKYLDRDTAYKIIDGTDPDLGTFIRSQHVFLRFLKVSKDIPLIDIKGNYFRSGSKNAILKDWANHGLCRFKWHRSLMSHVLGMVNKNHDLDRINMEFLINIDRKIDISYELDLYIRIYALIALQKNLLQQALQMIIYSGLNDISLSLPRICGFLMDCKNFLCISSSHIYYSDIIKESKDFNNTNGKKIHEYIKKLLDIQKKIMRCNGPEAFTYSSIDTGPQDNVSGSKGSVDDYDLSKITPHRDTYDWHQYDVIKELGSDGLSLVFRVHRHFKSPLVNPPAIDNGISNDSYGVLRQVMGTYENFYLEKVKDRFKVDTFKILNHSDNFQPPIDPRDLPNALEHRFFKMERSLKKITFTFRCTASSFSRHKSEVMKHLGWIVDEFGYLTRGRYGTRDSEILKTFLIGKGGVYEGLISSIPNLNPNGSGNSPNMSSLDSGNVSKGSNKSGRKLILHRGCRKSIESRNEDNGENRTDRDENTNEKDIDSNIDKVVTEFNNSGNHPVNANADDYQPQGAMASASADTMVQESMASNMGSDMMGSDAMDDTQDCTQ